MARIRIITPAPRGSRKGNRITAERYARLLRGLGHRVHVQTSYSGQCAELIIVLHAGKGASALRDFKRCCGDAKLAVLLTGTDVYGGLGGKAARASLDSADRILLLQPLAARELPPALRRKAVTVFQSAVAPKRPPARQPGLVLTVGHLRKVKDPLRAGKAARLVPPQSSVGVELIGGVLEPALGRAAQREQATNPRFHWRGETSPANALRRIAAAWLVCVPSIAEGGANVIAEACVCGTPVLATKVPGNVGMLGEDYPGYFKVGDDRALAKLMQRCEVEPTFYADLQNRCVSLAGRFSPGAEAKALGKLVRDLVQ